jgi:hypothetical protein
MLPRLAALVVMGISFGVELACARESNAATGVVESTLMPTGLGTPS